MSDDDLTLEVARTGDTNRTLVRLSGELDASTVGVLFDSVEPAQSAARLVLDLSDLSFVDSRGLGAFVAIGEKRRTLGREVEIVNASRPVARLFEIVGLDRLPCVHVRTPSAG